MHKTGEEDLRAVYIIVVIATLLNIASDELFEGISDYIASC